MEMYLILVGNLGKSALSIAESAFPDLQGRWLSFGRAYEILVAGGIASSAFEDLKNRLGQMQIDVFVVPSEKRRKGLLIADMDATIVTGETLDDMAALAGLGEEISQVTAAAMRGELDFEDALRMRVSKLKGLSEALLYKAFEDMTLSAGAKTLIQAMRGAGSACILVSGGFTFFTSRVAELCGFSAHHGNVLEVRDGSLTGAVIPPVLDKNAKLSFLKSHAADLGIGLDETVAVGDGANDLPMLLAAGLGVGYQPKPLVREQVQNSIIHSDLTSILYMQGFTQDDILSYTKN